MGYAEITIDQLSLDFMVEKVKSNKNGGLVTFSGDVRDNDNGLSVTAIDYHCYEAMALKELQKIVDSAEQKWSGTICAAIHRVGVIKVGESSVIIAVSAPHRAEAFEACRWIIDTVKTEVPIWKREEITNGKAKWIVGDEKFDAAGSIQ